MENNSFTNKHDSVTLENIFEKIISTDQKIETSIEVLEELIQNDLKLALDCLDDDKISALPFMLMRYIRNWPGWSRKQEYDEGSLDLKSWSLRFRNYICYKMKLLVTQTLPSFELDEPSDSSSNKRKLVDVSTQSETRGNFSNFNIDVSGPAILLNNLVFSGHEENIRVEQHAERPWVDLECADLLNYPYVEVEFNSPELSFKRSFEPKASLYLSNTPDLIAEESDFIVEESNFIMGKSSINSQSAKWPIKLSVLETYIEVLKKEVFSHFLLLSDQQEEFSTVLNQFYEDMVDISRNDIVYENKRITFNIGKSVYKRTKKINYGSFTSDILFNEVYLPKVISSFRYFTGMQHNAEKRIAADPNKINTKDMLTFKPRITYKCTFCKLAFEGCTAKASLIAHLQMLHKRAQTMICLKCNKRIEVTELSRRRWKCTCSTES